MNWDRVIELKEGFNPGTTECVARQIGLYILVCVQPQEVQRRYHYFEQNSTREPEKNYILSWPIVRSSIRPALFWQ